MSLVEWWAESDIGRAVEKFAALIDLNGREAAILIWLAAVILFCLVKRDIRGSLWGVVCAFTQWKILQWVAFMAIYTAGWVAVLAKLGLWGTSNLKTTVVWVLTFALVTMMEAAKLTEDKKSFGKLLREIVAPTVFVVFVAELHTFNVWAELMLLPVLALISGMLALAESRREHAIIVKPLTSLQAIIGVSFLIFSAYHIVSDFKAFATLDTLREFIVPIVLSLLFLPFLYAMAIFMAYESAFTGLSFRIEDRRLLGYAKRR